MENFRGLDYNEIKAKFTDKTDEELEKETIWNGMKIAECERSDNMLGILEHMANVVMISEILEERSK